MYGYLSYNPLAKVAYRPIDAALRWCNLMAHETQILKAAWHCPAGLAHSFPQRPCLHTNIEKILDAVRHTDLKQWMQHYYPDQRPAFLFEQPHALSATISVGSYLALQADRDALQLQLKQAQTTYQEALTELQAIGLSRRLPVDRLRQPGAPHPAGPSHRADWSSRYGSLDR